MKKFNVFLCVRSFFTVLVMVSISMLIISSRVCAAEDTIWQEEYTYTLDETNYTITLSRCNQTEKDRELVIPATAVINGVEYRVHITGTEKKEGVIQWPDEYFFHGDENIISVYIEDDVVIDNARCLFFLTPGLKQISFGKVDLTNATDMYRMFAACQNLENLNISGIDTRTVTNMEEMFSGCSSLKSLDLSKFDTSNVTDMSGMFSWCSGLESLDLGSFNTSSVTKMREMFSGCSSLKGLDLSGFDTSNVTDMRSMFSGCSSLESLNLSGFDTSKVVIMGNMFGACSSLESIDLSCFNTQNVDNMVGMFHECSSIKSLDLSGFDTGNVNKMEQMFFGCSSLESLDLSGFNTSNVTTMQEMFSTCTNLKTLNLSGFDTSNVRYMDKMFSGCSSLEGLDLSSFDLGAGVSFEDIFAFDSQLEIIYTPNKSGNISIKLPTTMYVLSADGALGDIGYDNLSDAPENSILVRQHMENGDILHVPDGYVDRSGSPMIVYGLNCSWKEVNGRLYWYENYVKQGTYFDAEGVMGDGTIRGREICDMRLRDVAGHQGVWFWLDACYDGAKAVGKEVWIPYVYQQEATWDEAEMRRIANESDEGMQDLVFEFMRDGKGKWVRYDENGAMLKGWVTIEGALEEKYPDQVGNTYYYDTRTGIMAKGWITMDGVTYHFDEVTGVLLN